MLAVGQAPTRRASHTPNIWESTSMIAISSWRENVIIVISWLRMSPRPKPFRPALTIHPGEQFSSSYRYPDAQRVFLEPANF